MLSIKLFITIFLHALVILGTSQAVAQSCIPSCEENDGKSVKLIPPEEAGLSTLAGEPLRIRIEVDEGEGELEWAIFDPDHTSSWDSVGNDDDGTTGNAIVSYTLYADPNRADNSTGLTQVFQLSSDDDDVLACPPSNFVADPYSPGDPDSVCNNAWRDLTIENSDEAHDGDAHYNYLLEVGFIQAGSAVNGTNFKIRVDNGEAFLFPGDIVTVTGEAAGRDLSAIPIVFPPFQNCDFPDGFPTVELDFSMDGACDCIDYDPDLPDVSACWSVDESTYDGDMTFNARFDPDPGYIITELVLWDGDFDFGNGLSNPGPDDTDDPDTPNDTLPGFGVSEFAEFENADPTGNPPENSPEFMFNGFSGLIQFFRGDPVTYTLVDPNGTEYLNENPSGDTEWERFSIRSNNHPDGCVVNVDADFCVADIPAGTWRVEISGLDNFNTIFAGSEMSVRRAPVEAQGIPTLTRWGTIVMIVLFGMIVVLSLRKRET